MQAIDALKTRLLEIDDLGGAASLLRWDQTTYMPNGGAPARGRQIATLSRMAHELFTAPETGRLLEQAEKAVASLPADSDEASLVRVTRRLFEQAVRVPVALVAESNEHFAAISQAWTVARPANDFAAVRPMLEKTLELSRRQAECFPGYESIADPLIDVYDYGMKAASVKKLFGELRGVAALVLVVPDHLPPPAFAILRAAGEFRFSPSCCPPMQRCSTAFLPPKTLSSAPPSPGANGTS
jgi:carboxypeptidase Taq